MQLDEGGSVMSTRNEVRDRSPDSNGQSSDVASELPIPSTPVPSMAAPAPSTTGKTEADTVTENGIITNTATGTGRLTDTETGNMTSTDTGTDRLTNTDTATGNMAGTDTGTGRQSNTDTGPRTEEKVSPEAIVEIESRTTTQNADEDETVASCTSSLTANLSLAGFTLCIDAGHQTVGNSDLEPIAPGSATLKAQTSTGTCGRATGVPEYKLNLAVSLLLQEELQKLGATVVMTREKNDVDLGNIDRAEIGNKANADLVIRIHADGSDNPGVHGLSVLVPSEKHVGKEIAAKSRAAGDSLYDALVESTGAKGRGVVVRADLTGFNWSTVPVVLVELGFMTNADEDRKLQDDAYRHSIIQGMVQGVLQYLARKG